jgi:predicted enzyme related to lactoylglutathione lyase
MTTYSQPKAAGTPTWTDLITPDAESARKFYEAVFGWKYDISGPEFGGYATALVGSRSAAGIVGNNPNFVVPAGAWSLYFASSDLDADVAHAVKLGATVTAPAMTVGDMGGMAVLQDPTGAAFGFWKAHQHIGSQVTDEPGATTWFELYSPDAKKSRDFYKTLLGAEAEPMPGGLEYYTLKHGDEMLAGIMQIDPSWGPMPSQWVTYFSVTDAAKTAALVTQSGGKQMGGIDESPFGRIAALSDAQGAMFKIVQPPTR